MGVDLERGRERLSMEGLNLFAVLNVGQVAAALQPAARAAAVSLESYASLILVGHRGNTMWRRMKGAATAGPDPVDAFSICHIQRFVDEALGGCPHHLLYPGPFAVPLQQLGALAGWHHPSPLGIGVNALCGPWFGYRAALLVEPALPATDRNTAPPPCQTCAEKPCLQACPARALGANHPPDLSACLEHRLGTASSCSLTCLARLACPVGSEYRYDAEQIEYFYGRSLASIRRYRANPSVP